MTIVPNYLITGILAITVGLAVVIWFWIFIEKKHSAWTLLFLSLLLFFVGGGIAPIFMMIFACITTGRINKPLRWWRTHLPGTLQKFLISLWPWSAVIFILFSLLILEFGIFGYPLLWIVDAATAYIIILVFGYLFFIIMLFMILTAIAYDIKHRPV